MNDNFDIVIAADVSTLAGLVTRNPG